MRFVIAAALFLQRICAGWFAVRNGQVDQFDVEVLYRQSMAIVGYGEIGRAVAKRAKAPGMKVYLDSPGGPNC